MRSGKVCTLGGAVAVAALVVGAGLGLGAPAAAPAPAPAPAGGAVTQSLGPREHIDWTRGLLVATAGAPADLREPSPEIARIKAERQARQRVRDRLAQLARQIPLADGRHAGAALDRDRAARVRLDTALDHTIDVDIDYASDGTVVITAGLPLEAVRAAIAGPAGPPAAHADAPTALVVDARGVKLHPALGLALAADHERYAGPTVFVGPGADLEHDARLGAHREQATARRVHRGALELRGNDSAGHLARARDAGALVVIITKESR